MLQNGEHSYYHTACTATSHLSENSFPSHYWLPTNQGYLCSILPWHPKYSGNTYRHWQKGGYTLKTPTFMFLFLTIASPISFRSLGDRVLRRRLDLPGPFHVFMDEVSMKTGDHRILCTMHN